MERETRRKRGNQSVMFQVYTDRKRIDLSMISLTSTEHNINTSVVIMFHMTCEQTCPSLRVHVSLFNTKHACNAQEKKNKTTYL